MTFTKSNKITLAICFAILFGIGVKVAIDTKQAKARSVQSQNTEPNYIEIIEEKDRKIQYWQEQAEHWKQMSMTLEKRNAENVKEFEKQYKKLHEKK